MKHRLLSIKVDGGLDVVIEQPGGAAVVTTVRQLTASLEGDLHLKVAEKDMLVYRRWLLDLAGVGTEYPGVGAMWKRIFAVTLGTDTWSFVGCFPVQINEGGTEVILRFDTPKKNGRALYASLG